jgi:hypothetical protein
MTFALLPDLDSSSTGCAAIPFLLQVSHQHEFNGCIWCVERVKRLQMQRRLRDQRGVLHIL